MNTTTQMFMSDEVDFDNLAENVWERCDNEDLTDDDIDLDFFASFLEDCWDDNEFDEENDFACSYDILDWGQGLLPIYLDNVEYEENEVNAEFGEWVSINHIEKYVNDITDIIVLEKPKYINDITDIIVLEKPY